MYYEFRQNNSGGSFQYNESMGISVKVLVEADSAEKANDRAESIGIYFDGAFDCSCCGNRWYSVDEYEVFKDEVPQPDDPFIIDESARFTDSKWVKGYEGFVHPKNGPFYGYGKETKTINPKQYTSGYGLGVGLLSVGDIFACDERGWDKTGNRHCPAPGTEDLWLTNSNRIVDTDSLVVEYNEERHYLNIWCLNKPCLMKIRKTALEAKKKAAIVEEDMVDKIVML